MPLKLDENTKRFIGILGKIPMFQRLLPVQSLEICRPRTFDNLEVLIKHGSKSTEMYILLSGQLTVRGPAGTTIATLTPLTSVGEMGIITGQPRTATVVSVGKSNAFEISKIKFEVMLKKFPDIGFVIFRNIILTLPNRLDTTNQQLTEKNREVDRLNIEGQPVG